MDRAQRQFCLETPGLRLASSLGEFWRQRLGCEVSNTGRWQCCMVGDSQRWGLWLRGLLEDVFVLEQWIMSMGRPAITDAQPTPSHHPPMPGPCLVKLFHAGSWSDVRECGWIRAECGGNSVLGPGSLPGLVSLPSLALPRGSQGGARRSPGRDKSAPHLLQLHPAPATPQRKMKAAVLSVALLFTMMLCTPGDAQVSSPCHGEGLKAGDGSWLQDIRSQHLSFHVSPLAFAFHPVHYGTVPRSPSLNPYSQTLSQSPWFVPLQCSSFSPRQSPRLRFP